MTFSDIFYVLKEQPLDTTLIIGRELYRKVNYGFEERWRLGANGVPYTSINMARYIEAAPELIWSLS